MITQILSLVPWEGWAALAACGAWFIYFRFGGKATALYGAVAAMVIAFLAGRKAERAQGWQQEQQHANQVQNSAEAARIDAERTPDDKLREPSPFQRD